MIWDKLKNFNIKENWGNPSKINGSLLLILDSIRLDWENEEHFIIHCAYESGHSTGSEHEDGDAVDFHIETNSSFPIQVYRIIRSLEDLQIVDRVGLGIYPTWKHPGFHLGVGIKDRGDRWGRIGNNYCSFEEALAYAKLNAREL